MIAQCWRCEAVVRGDLVEVRVELRAADGQRRLRTWLDHLLCRECADLVASHHDRGVTLPPPMPPRPGDDANRPWLGWLTPEQMVGRLLAIFGGGEVVADGRSRQWPPPGHEFYTAWNGERRIRRAPTRCECRAMLTTPTTVEVRTEQREAGTLRRLRTWTTRRVCRPCADRLAAEHDARGAA